MKKFSWLLVFSFVRTAFSQESVTVPLLEEYLVAQGLPVQVGMDTVTKDDFKEIQKAGMFGKFQISKDGWVLIGGPIAVGAGGGIAVGEWNGEIKVSRSFQTGAYGTQIAENLVVKNDGKVVFRIRKSWPPRAHLLEPYYEIVVPDAREVPRLINIVAGNSFPDAADIRLNFDVYYSTHTAGKLIDPIITIHPEAREIVVRETLRRAGVPIPPGEWQHALGNNGDPLHLAQEALSKASKGEVSAEYILDEFKLTLSNEPEIKPMSVEDIVQRVPDESLEPWARTRLQAGRKWGAISGGLIGMAAGAVAGGFLYSLVENNSPGGKPLSIDDKLKLISPYLQQWKSVQSGNGLMAAHDSPPIPLSLALFTAEVREFIHRKKLTGAVPITIYRVENRT